ncbi:putative ammonium transporter, marine subtype [Arcobacter nitrofigilis DSM 7299]|uniref:Putative ammonium transporter, marine subtype n=1 Tax=Arcobacter nitrofigilis (strain ATCC 33309 / DSM 7299 / CCUG 15893 / LMG 7604 / NCTC 12251 / CI) TaxID=572480 RepID=D5V7B5_ARCNC|nr:ammonium transporter [Arcobacter nitrofigilis]ADG94535.1 putative ammonium transporter, marine subtype [Arcobacter nitrofigilis DSM 7299]
MENFADVKYVLDGFLFIIMGVLVMWMAAGFAMLESGLTRSKNNATVLTKNLALFAISCMMYYFVGYNLMYGDGGSIMGSFSTISMKTAADAAYPAAADFFFQVVFVATAASVISGSIAERMKLWPFLIFTVILSGVIYPIQGHWSWGGSELGGVMAGFSDFAGSTIVHSVGGWAALAGVLILGARKGKYGKDGSVRPIPGSNLTLATLGTFILWMGWFGFNGGSQLALGSKADIDGIALVVADTNMAACAGAIMAAVLTQLIYKKVDLTMVLNGALAGLVSCTAGPDLGMMVAFIEGIVGGALVVFAVPMFDKLRIDDPVGALSVHLVAGIWGTLAVGIFNPEVTIMAQVKGIVIVGAFVFIASFVVWKILDLIVGLRVSEEIEVQGLDIHETGLETYPEFKRA